MGWDALASVLSLLDEVAELERVVYQNQSFVRIWIPLFPYHHLPIPSDTDSGGLEWGLGLYKMILMQVSEGHVLGNSKGKDAQNPFTCIIL